MVNPRLPLLSTAMAGRSSISLFQIIALLFIVIWIEGDIALFRRKGSPFTAHDDAERDTPSGAGGEVRAEEARVQNAESDLLRVLHLSKSFKSNTAVDDVSFGLPASDVMALIGPNGAGKSTLVNLIQSELSADTGKVLLRGEDARTRSAQRYLGGKRTDQLFTAEPRLMTVR